MDGGRREEAWAGVQTVLLAKRGALRGPERRGFCSQMFPHPDILPKTFRRPGNRPLCSKYPL